MKVAAFLREHPDASANDVYKAIGGNRTSVLDEVKRQREAPTEVLTGLEEFAR